MNSSLDEIEKLVEEHSGMLLKIAMHYVGTIGEAEDAVQEVFLRLIRGNPQFTSAEHEKAWLIRAACCVCKDTLKTAWHRKTVSLQDELPLTAEPSSDHDGLLPVIRKLPEKYRNVIFLYYYEGLPVAEIARVFGVSENTVSSWLFRARARLKTMLKGDWDNAC